MSNPLADLLLDASRNTPDRVAITTDLGATWTYRDLDERSAQLAQVLVEHGVRPGDRVAVQTAKSPDVIALHIACVRAGGVYLPLNSAYTERELGDLLDDAEPALLVRDEPLDHSTPRASLASLLEQADTKAARFTDVDRAPEDPASILYTSGTTGRPKGAVMSHANLVFSGSMLADYWGFTDRDVLLHILPLFHTHGLFVAAYCSLITGGRLLMIENFDPQTVISLLPQATVMMGVPTHYTRLLAEPGFTRELTQGMRLFTSGSAPMLVATHDEFRERTGQTILERYGMTETCMLTSNPLVGERKVGTVGPALPGVEVRVVNGSPGAVEVRGPNVFGGYWRRPELQSTEFTADGWFKTGDLGRLDPDGYLEIVGRSKDLVISGGLNVYPKEVEAVLDALPGVLESAVVGLPDPDFGEAVTAAVIAEPGMSLDPEELRRLARAELAAFKVPKRIEIMASLPRNTMGKVEKAKLRQSLADSTTGR